VGHRDGLDAVEKMLLSQPGIEPQPVVTLSYRGSYIYIYMHVIVYTRCSLCRLIRLLSTWCRAAAFFSTSGPALSQEVPTVTECPINLRSEYPILMSNNCLDLRAGTHYNAATCNTTVAAATYDVYVHRT
jgi:hypothetical protein